MIHIGPRWAITLEILRTRGNCIVHAYALTMWLLFRVVTILRHSFSDNGKAFFAIGLADVSEHLVAL